MKKGFIIVISGPTGVGKTTVVKKLLEQMPNSMRIVTTTTRQMRPGEKNGEDYHFVTKEEFEKAIEEDKMFEYTKFIKGLRTYYGTRKEDFLKPLDEGKIVIFTCDPVDGLQAIKKEYPDQHVSIFIDYEKIQDIEYRLTHRKQQTPQGEIEKRILTARHEKEYAKHYDHVVTNKQGELEKIVNEVMEIVKNSIHNR